GSLRQYEELAYFAIVERTATVEKVVSERNKFGAEEGAARASETKMNFEAVSADVAAQVQKRAVEPNIPFLERAGAGASTGNSQILGVPPGNLIGLQIPGPSAARSTSNAKNPFATELNDLGNTKPTNHFRDPADDKPVTGNHWPKQ